MGFLLRWMIAFALVAATYNPTQWNFWRWAGANWRDQMSVTVFLALVLLVAYVIFLRATFRSIGTFGMILVAAVFAALVWVLVDFGALALTNSDGNIWLGILALSLVLAIGLSWSFVRRALSGQYDVDDADGYI